MKGWLRQLSRDLKAVSTCSPGIGLWYFYLTAKNVLLTKILKLSPKKQKFLGYTMHFDSFNSFYALFTEIFVHQIYKRELTKRPVIIDAGANIGMASLYFKWRRPQAKIYCYEPDPETFILLEKNMSQLTNITCYEVALSNKDGFITLFATGKFVGGAGNTVSEDCTAPFKDRIVKVKSLRLSQHIKKLSKVDFLKIDIEGNESKVLKDLEKHLQLKKIDQMSLEFHYVYEAKDNLLSIVTRVLEDAGYVFTINPDTLITSKVKIKNVAGKLRYGLIIDATKRKFVNF